jgi:hypothetical protein
MSALLNKSALNIKLGDYSVGPATALFDGSLLPRVQEYRRQSSGRMYPLDRDDIRRKIPKAEYHVSRKIDGEFTVLIWSDGEICTLNPGGTVRVGLPFMEEAARLLSKAKVKHAMIAGELYVQRKDRRARVHDVTTLGRQPESKDDLKKLAFAAFDIVSWEGQPIPFFADAWKNLQRTFGTGERIHPVEAKAASNAQEIEKIFEEWVVNENAEGLVVRSETAGFFKVKPRHTLDLAVIGFTESVGDRKGMLHDLLLAVKRHDGALHVLTRVGGGFDEDERRTMLADLKDMAVESEYAEVNSDHVAYQMVEPEWVIELSCLDLISETTRGGPVNRMVLDYKNNGSKAFHVVRRMPLASVISPQFIRRRLDKSVTPHETGIEQVSKIVEVPGAERNARQMTLPSSEVLRREVFVKTMKDETMVRKFVMWKTNKDSEAEDYPSYVIHYTDFSPNRKTPLNRDVRVSSSEEQIQSLWSELKVENIKKGWDLHATTAAAPIAAKPEVIVSPEPVVVQEEPAKAPAAKKPRAPKKKTAASEEAPTKAPSRRKKSG